MTAGGSLKGEVAELRRDMRAARRTWREIALVIRDRHRITVLVAFRLAHGWTQAEVAARYNDAWPSQQPRTHKHISYWENWRLGAPPSASARMPSYRDLDRLAQLYKCAVADLLDGGDYSDHDSNARQIVLSGHNEVGVSPDLMVEEGDRTNRRNALKLSLIGAVTPEVVRRVLADAADEAMEFTRLSAASGVGAGTLDHLHAVVMDLDRAFYSQPLAQVFNVARAYRRRVQELIQGRHTLAEGRELYVYAGWLDEQLAWLTRNLGDPRAAEAYAIDCFEHADQAGHDELCGYAAMVMATIPMHDADQPERAIGAIRKGVAKTPSPSHIAVRLRSQAAEIHARLGQHDESAEMLRQAKNLYDRLPPRVTCRFTTVNALLTEYDMLGYAARADAWLRNDDAAKQHGEQALTAFRSATAGSPLPGKDSGVRLDLAHTLARLGSPEEAVELGNQGLAFANRFRMELPRARRLDKALTGRYPSLSEAREFHERYRAVTRAA